MDLFHISDIIIIIIISLLTSNFLFCFPPFLAFQKEQNRLLLQAQQMRMEKVLMRGEILEDGMDMMGVPPGLSPPRNTSTTSSQHGMGMNVGYGNGVRGYDVMDMGLLGVGGLSSDRNGRSGSVDNYDHELALLHQQQLATSNGSGSILSGTKDMQI